MRFPTISNKGRVSLVWTQIATVKLLTPKSPTWGLNATKELSAPSRQISKGMTSPLNGIAGVTTAVEFVVLVEVVVVLLGVVVEVVVVVVFGVEVGDDVVVAVLVVVLGGPTVVVLVTLVVLAGVCCARARVSMNNRRY